MIDGQTICLSFPPLRDGCDPTIINLRDFPDQQIPTKILILLLFICNKKGQQIEIIDITSKDNGPIFLRPGNMQMMIMTDWFRTVIESRRKYVKTSY